MGKGEELVQNISGESDLQAHVKALSENWPDGENDPTLLDQVWSVVPTAGVDQQNDQVQKILLFEKDQLSSEKSAKNIPCKKEKQPPKRNNLKAKAEDSQ